MIEVSTPATAVLERQLLLQFGDRLKRLRKAQGMSAVDMAGRVGVSRTTLAAVEAGDPGPSIGTYLRVMSVLGVGGELALLASDTLRTPMRPAGPARSRNAMPEVQVTVSLDETRHRAQDLQSLALHEEAVRLVRADPALLEHARDTLERWIGAGDSRSIGLWLQWRDILQQGTWRKALGRTRRAQALRQASPLVTVLPEAVRRDVLAQVGELRKGIVLGTDPVGRGS